MYRQILIRTEDRPYQHILWREFPHDPLQEYELNTVTYGVSSSPYLAIRTLRQLADEHCEQFPLATKVLRDETYIDDIITGCSSIENAIQLRDDLVALLKLGLRLLIRSRIAKCIKCFRAKAVPCQPIMGDLPIARLQPGKCFKSVGIDFSGPFTVKESRRRNARTYKAYLCLFVCLTIKAVHLEAVTELSSEAFLAALDPFVARRELCSKIITDCVGEPLVTLPEDTWDEASHPRTRWQMLQKLNQCFWRTWQRDYLHTLQQKIKWLKLTPNIKLNDVVIIVEPNLPPTQWRLAIVEELHPGKDNVVRVVCLRTADGHFLKRPVVKTCPIPIN
ncbi:hypothetical protein EVAR_51392_1 [Eumeta japonica]|uniref:DUF5641 domain-containing protein n=1 Tax=Eumeta variegata TaxID=151549 RepID=A0A4C1ZUG3_EUMVA|nr:hypothetical protein EVAR_51392_1 [Eumeta japonica]